MFTLTSLAPFGIAADHFEQLRLTNTTEFSTPALVKRGLTHQPSLHHDREYHN
jgi:hypothetical protein